MDHLTEEQQQEVEDVFKIIDENNNGTIDIEELGKGLRCLGLNPTNSDLKNLLEQFDKNNDKVLNLDEFSSLYVKYTQTFSSVEDDLAEEFKKLDVNGDGFIDVEELKKVLTFGDEKLSEEEVADVIKEFDANGDGKITLEEFIHGVLSKSS
jgi:calmodulin